MLKEFRVLNYNNRRMAPMRDWICPKCGAKNEGTRIWCLICGWIQYALRRVS